MYGAILGDMVGAPYEFDRGNKSKDFPLFSRGTEFTDDSVMSIAVAEALMASAGKADEEIETALVSSMQKWGRKYPDAGYGGRFIGWLWEEEPKPYGSFGNGSAMRASSAGWLYDSLKETGHMAELTAKVTHNHPEGVKGAVVMAGVIFLARNGATKPEIRAYAEGKGYDLSRTCDEIRPDYHHVESCQQTVPEAITALLEGTDFEDVIRTAVSLGGDCDTLTCIAGGMAEAYYGVPQEMIRECRERLPEEMLKVADDLDRSRHFARVRRTDWAAEPMPEKHETFTLGRHFSEEEIGRLKNGHIPKEMEDKWFWYMEDMRLYAHRSWTGTCVFTVDIDPESGKHKVTVNRDSEQYGCNSIEEDTETLNMLLNYWTKPEYDYYSEWLGETYNSLVKSGQIQPPREVITEDITNEMINDLAYEDIKAFMFAEGGAMGCPGEVRVFSIEDEKVYLKKKNFAFGDFRICDFDKHFSPLRTLQYQPFGDPLYIEDGWKYVMLGAGNHLIMTDDVYEEFKDNIKDKRPPEIYQMFEDGILEILKNI